MDKEGLFGDHFRETKNEMQLRVYNDASDLVIDNRTLGPHVNESNLGKLEILPLESENHETILCNLKD